MVDRDKNVEAPPRVRLSSNIDLSKAKPGCNRCNGNGITGYKTADLQDGGGEQKIPIVCRCVSRNGGVKTDELDRILKQAGEHIDEGVFHEHVVADFHATTEDQKPRIVAAFYRDIVDDRKSPASIDSIKKVLDLLKKRNDWHNVRGHAIRILMRDASDPICDEATRELATRAMKVARQSMN